MTASEKPVSVALRSTFEVGRFAEGKPAYRVGSTVRVSVEGSAEAEVEGDREGDAQANAKARATEVCVARLLALPEVAEAIRAAVEAERARLLHGECFAPSAIPGGCATCGCATCSRIDGVPTCHGCRARGRTK